ncbi:DUF1194 domain-containing protein [Thalassotalea euphylliae]|uniref:DUF1194 domain-containing protein n=1 Tax=Thalassotalea euphylliae TaxID=1655234 RepID=UPI0036250A0F
MKRMRYKLCFLAAMLATTHSYAITPVDVELQLLVDISGSVNSTEYDLQMMGYSNAFASERVQDAIINGTEGSIAVQLIMWSGSGNQQVMIDWTLVDSADAAHDLSTVMANIARPFSGWTAIGSAIEYGYPLFVNNDFAGTKNVIDISGDGTNNSGISPAAGSAAALANGVDTINGIVITTDDSVIDQYAEQVVGGDTPFLLAPATFNDFQRAIENKIVAEIQGTTPQGAVPIPEPNISYIFSAALLLIWLKKQFGGSHEAS